MKIFLIASECPPVPGGIATYVGNTAAMFSDAGHDIVVKDHSIVCPSGTLREHTVPRPIMTDRSFDMSYVSSDRTPCVENIYAQNTSEFDVGYEMMIDGAQCVRLGKDIIVNVATENHWLGFQWLERH
jgi:hypothetical protein